MSARYKSITFTTLACLFLLTGNVFADNLKIPGHMEVNSQLVMPSRGQSMDKVLAEFGEPERRIEAIGQPPITEWDYVDFRVYFVYSTVLHSLNLTTLITPRQ